jgi:hypothetical protein
MIKDWHWGFTPRSASASTDTDRALLTRSSNLGNYFLDSSRGKEIPDGESNPETNEASSPSDGPVR